MKKLYLIFTFLIIPTFTIAATWENYTTEKIEISEGIYKDVKTFTSGRTEETIMMQIEDGIVSGYFEVDLVDGEFKLNDKGAERMERAKAGGNGEPSGSSGGSSGGSGGGSGGGC